MTYATILPMAWLRLIGTTIVVLLVLEVFLRFTIVSPINFTYHAGLGYVHAPNQYVTYSFEGFSRFWVNNLGLNDEDIHLPDLEHKKRVLIIGDSVTAAVQVETHQNFVSLADEKLSNFHLLNAGYDGLSPLEYIPMLQKISPHYQPQHTVLVMNQGDIAEITKDLMYKNPFKRNYLGDITLAEPEDSSPPAWIDYLIRTSGKSSLLTLSFYSLFKWQMADQKKLQQGHGVDNYQGNIDITEALEYVFLDTKPSAIFYIPVLTYHAHGISRDTGYDKQQEHLIQQVAKARNIPFLSLRNVFKESYTATKQPLTGFHNSFSRTAGHLNKHGHTIVAQYLTEQLSSLLDSQL